MKLTKEQIALAIMQTALIAKLLSDHDLPAIIAEAERFDAFAPYFDSTRWMHDRTAVQTNRNMLEAAIPLWQWAKEQQRKLETPTTDNQPMEDHETQ